MNEGAGPEMSGICVWGTRVARLIGRDSEVVITCLAWPPFLF